MSLRFILLVFIIALNAFFSAAEVALLVARRPRLEELARQGNTAARAALGMLANTERLLSVIQIGITMASLALGWAGEETIYLALSAGLPASLTAGQAQAVHIASYALAFLIASFVHIVVGEVVPKNLALDQADRLALLFAPSLLAFDRLSSPFVYLIEKASAGILGMLGIRSRQTGGHSAEELKLIVAASGEAGHLEDFEEESIRRLLGLKDVYAREIMTPRMDIVSVPVTATLDELLEITLEHKHSRLPVYEGSPEHIIGIVHYKDLVRAWRERKTFTDRGQPAPPFSLRRYLRPVLVIPETKPLTQLVDEFRTRQTHLAMVVDEFGTITGLVTMEDVLEQIFGEIGDEYDVRRTPPAAGAPVFEVDGNTSILDLASQYGIKLPGDAGFETLAGFLLLRLGDLPSPGDVVTYGNHTFTVLSMDHNRIGRVKIVTRPSERPEKPPPQAVT